VRYEEQPRLDCSSVRLAGQGAVCVLRAVLPCNIIFVEVRVIGKFILRRRMVSKHYSIAFHTIGINMPEPKHMTEFVKRGVFFIGQISTTKCVRIEYNDCPRALIG